MAYPAIILVHGFWGGAAHWSKVIPALDTLGHTALEAVEMPLTSFADDVGRVTKMIAQHDGPVGLVGGQALGDVAGLVYIAAFAPDDGESPGSITQQNLPAGAAALAPDSDGYLWVLKDKYHENFCQDLSAEEARVMAVTQKAPLATNFGDTISNPAWRNKDCWYQISSEDRMIHPDNQAMMSGRMNAKKVITLPASHASLASMPAEIAALIDEAARAVGG